MADVAMEAWRRAARAVAYVFLDGELEPLHECILAELLAEGRAIERGDVHRRVARALRQQVTVAEVQRACTEGRLARLVATVDRGDGRGVAVRCAVPRTGALVRAATQRHTRRRRLVVHDTGGTGAAERDELIRAARARLQTLSDAMCARAGVDALDAPDFERLTRLALLNDGVLAHDHADRILRVAREVQEHARALGQIDARETLPADAPLPKRSRSA